MSPDACRYCERNAGQELPDETTASWVAYAQYLLARWQEWEMGLLDHNELKGFEKRYLIAVNRTIIRYRKEIEDRRRHMNQ